MAVIEVELGITNPTPVNGGYTFITNFYNATTDALLVDVKFPQGQVHTTNTISNPYFLPINIADGNYNISNVKVKIGYKDKIYEHVIPNQTIDCAADCSMFPITAVTRVTNTSYNVGLTSQSTATFNWKIISSVTEASVANGVANVNNASSFLITIPTLNNGDYLLEVTGSTCKGKDIKIFTIANTLDPCEFGPNLLNVSAVTNTSLQFNFDGTSVFGIAWEIRQGINVIRQGIIKHVSVAQPGDATFSNAYPTISYGALTDGNYTLHIQGSTCSSAITSQAFTVTGSVAPLQFISGSPSVTGSAGNYTMNVAINKSGVYNTVILNSTTGVYEQNGNITYVANTPYIKTGLPVGVYIVKVGTLETIITIQNTGGSPCTHGPLLSSIFNNSAFGLQFLFDGQGVTAITWRIKQGATIVRNGVVYPSNNIPFISYNELPVGSYTLEIEGNNCSSAVSSSGFTVSSVPVGNNAGVIVTNVGNKYIGIINGKDFKAEANPTTGAVRLIYNEISTADQGGKQVKGWLLGSQLQETKASEVASLRSSNGLVLPDGNYHFYLYYAATDIATTYAQLKNNLYTLFLNPETWPFNSRTLEEVIIEVKTNI